MIEKLRCRCPLCGMIFDESKLNSSSPYKIQVFLQKFGGKVAGNEKGRGKAKGVIKYLNVTKDYPDIVKEIKKREKLMSD